MQLCFSHPILYLILSCIESLRHFKPHTRVFTRTLNNLQDGPHKEELEKGAGFHPTSSAVPSGLDALFHLPRNPTLGNFANNFLDTNEASSCVVVIQLLSLPGPSLSPRACSNSCRLSQLCQPTISSSVDPFSSCPWSFPASGSLPVSWLFTSGSQSIEASASVHLPPVCSL